MKRVTVTYDVHVGEWEEEALREIAKGQGVQLSDSTLADTVRLVAGKATTEFLHQVAADIQNEGLNLGPLTIFDLKDDDEESDGTTLANLWEVMEPPDRAEFLLLIGADPLSAKDIWMVDTRRSKAPEAGECPTELE